MSAAKKILLADDDKEDRAIFEEMLEDLGSAGLTHYAIDGEDALSFLRTCATFPSLIILDLNMPRLNGKETLHAIRKDARFASIPVYIYSTSLNPIERDECLLLGAAEYIVKPVSYEDSVATAKRFLEIALR